jgi:membrane-associated phospholipid phosphatase
MKKDIEIILIKNLQNVPNKYKNTFTKIMRLISILFNYKLYILIIFVLYFSNIITIRQVFIICISQIILFLIKNIIKRKRPFNTNKNIELLELDNFDQYSFPSGHTLNAFLLSQILQKNIGINLNILAYLVGLSRIYLGVHYPTDIIGAIILSKIIISLLVV